MGKNIQRIRSPDPCKPAARMESKFVSDPTQRNSIPCRLNGKMQRLLSLANPTLLEPIIAVEVVKTVFRLAYPHLMRCTEGEKQQHTQ
jgi:hypothetical protein